MINTLLFIVIFLFIFLSVLYFIGARGSKNAEEIQYGVTFSWPFSARFEGIDWKENYLAILDDLNVKKIRLAAYWDELEKNEGEVFFEDLDWQINEAKKRNVKIVLAVGRRLPRWPECHVPVWAKELDEETIREKLLVNIERVVNRYKDSVAIDVWQVENEPFLSTFGECPKTEMNFLKKEIDLVRSLDGRGRPILISDSGEFGLWYRATSVGDIFGTTMYRVVFTKLFGQLTYPLPPAFFRVKAGFLKLFYGFDKKIIVIELQAEPWGKKLLFETPISVHKASMDHKQFLHNLEYAKNVGFSENYLWGAEWWYWAKETQNDPFYWDEAKKLFKQQD